METEEILEQRFFLTSTSNKKFGVRSFLPAGKKPRAIIQLIHGMAEHSGRYSEFARYLAGQGIGLFGADHPGHGLSVTETEGRGVVSGTKGWETMLENIRALYTSIRKEHPDIPVFILGHSMGSALARHFMAIYPVYIQGLIFSGPFGMPAPLLRLLRMTVRGLILIHGSRAKSKWFNRLFYSSLNRYFKPRPTPFEWISSSRKEVDAYAADPGCGFECSNGFYRTLFMGIAAMKRSQHNLKYRKTLPVLILSGQDDPVGHFGKDALRIHQHFYKQRFRNLTLKVVPGGRHELLHEKDKQKIFEYLLNWLDNHGQSSWPAWSSQ
jgi:alpha-beta hydrolase superfamily lysophospholipase